MSKYPVEKLGAIFTNEQLFLEEPMSMHTTFKVGGKADACVIVSNGDELKTVLKFAKEEGIPYTILGFGSNVLVSDNGIEGIVILMKNADYQAVPEPLDKERCRFSVPAGASLASFAKQAAKLGFMGTEFAAGIPGSVGGAIAMNAGAYGGEIKDIIESAVVIDGNLEEYVLSKDELELAYRNSIIQRKKLYVVSADFVLYKGEVEESMDLISELNAKRREKQPLEYPSAGSTFKRPEGLFAGKLIQDAGLAGFSVGGAQVSEKHCGFVINKDNATAGDIYKLIARVQQKVYEQFGVYLETEVRMMGDFSYAE